MAEKLHKGGEYLIKETSCEYIFTPEDFTDEQRQMGGTTEQFVEKEIKPHIESIEKQNFDLVLEGMQKAGELGLLTAKRLLAEASFEAEKHVLWNEEKWLVLFLIFYPMKSNRKSII